MPVALPLADADVLARRAEIVATLKGMVPGEGVIAAENARLADQFERRTVSSPERNNHGAKRPAGKFQR